MSNPLITLLTIKFPGVKFYTTEQANDIVKSYLSIVQISEQSQKMMYESPVLKEVHVVKNLTTWDSLHITTLDVAFMCTYDEGLYVLDAIQRINQ